MILGCSLITINGYWHYEDKGSLLYDEAGVEPLEAFGEAISQHLSGALGCVHEMVYKQHRNGVDRGWLAHTRGMNISSRQSPEKSYYVRLLLF